MTSPASPVTNEFLLKLAPRMSGAKAAKQREIIKNTAAVFERMAAYAELSTPLRIAHFLAQLAHESDGFATTEEYASGSAYEGRRDLGNTQRGDGRRFKGRGLIQVTGRANYAAFDQWAAANGLIGDFIGVPSSLASFPAALWSAQWYWSSRKLNQYADRDDLATVTNVINCGRIACKANGGHSRAEYLARAKQLLGADAPARLLKQGLSGADVKKAQEILAALGIFQDRIDGVYGLSAAQAVMSFQQANGLKVDGVLGGNTAAKLYARAPLTMADMRQSLGGEA